MVSMKNIKPQVDLNINRQLVEFESYSDDNSLMENKIGRVISRQLKLLDKTQGWLAEEANVSNNAVSKWIKTGKVSRNNAVRVAEILGLSVGQLLVNESEKPKDKEQKRLALMYIDPSEVHLVTLYRESTQHGKDMITMAAEEAPKLLLPQSARPGNDQP